MRKPKTTSKELAELRARVTQWRGQEGGGRGSRIPEELWQEAVRVARSDGLYATAKALQFNYERLKERSGELEKEREPATQVAEIVKAKASSRKLRSRAGKGGGRSLLASSPDGERGDPSARFIALKVAPVAPSRTGSQTMIELWGHHGERMRVEVAGGIDVVGLVQSLWGRTP
jgi:hypothetical protein